MFKFLREMVDAIKEGAAEANQEFAAEQDVKKAAQREQVAGLERRLATTADEERLLCAVAAPYREVFLSELSTAKDEDRPPLYLFCCDLPEKEVESWKSLLNRDFDIEDGEDAAAFVDAFVTTMGDTEVANASEAAVWLVRAAHVATGAASVGYVDRGQALDLANALVPFAPRHFGGWQQLGAAFLAGERSAPGSNILGRKFLARAVTRLNEDERSPWRKLDWPTRWSPPS